MHSEDCKRSMYFCFKKVYSYEHVVTFCHVRKLLGLGSALAQVFEPFFHFPFFRFGLKTIGLRNGPDVLGLPSPLRMQNGLPF